MTQAQILAPTPILTLTPTLTPTHTQTATAERAAGEDEAATKVATRVELREVAAKAVESPAEGVEVGTGNVGIVGPTLNLSLILSLTLIPTHTQTAAAERAAEGEEVATKAATRTGLRAVAAKAVESPAEGVGVGTGDVGIVVVVMVVATRAAESWAAGAMAGTGEVARVVKAGVARAMAERAVGLGAAGLRVAGRMAVAMVGAAMVVDAMAEAVMGVEIVVAVKEKAVTVDLWEREGAQWGVGESMVAMEAPSVGVERVVAVGARRCSYSFPRDNECTRPRPARCYGCQEGTQCEDGHRMRSQWDRADIRPPQDIQHGHVRCGTVSLAV